MTRAIVLLSGGLDSSTVLALARRDAFEVYAMTFRYGQRHAVEIESARQIARHARVADHVIVDIDLRTFGGSALTGPAAVPKSGVARRKHLARSAVPTHFQCLNRL